MIESPAAVFATIAAVVAFFFWVEQRTQWRGFEVLPPIVWVYAIPVALNNSGVLPSKSLTYDLLGDIGLPSLLVLMLISIDIRLALRVVGRGILAMLFASFGVVFGAVLAYWLTRDYLAPDAWKMFGALSGAWIGGSGNTLAVAAGVGLDPAGLGVVVLADNMVFLCWLPLLIAAKRIAPWFNRWTGVDAERVARLDEAAAAMNAPERPILVADVMYLIAICACVVFGAGWIADQLPEMGPVMSRSTWRTLLITTIAIAVSFTKARQLPGAREAGIGLMYLFLASVGARASFTGLEGAPAFVGACFLWIALHGAFCVIGAKLLRIDIHTAVIASAANIGGPASAPVVAAHHRPSLMPVSILMALLGYAAGNYLAFLTAHLCSLLARK